MGIFYFVIINYCDQKTKLETDNVRATNHEPKMKFGITYRFKDNLVFEWFIFYNSNKVTIKTLFEFRKN